MLRYICKNLTLVNMITCKKDDNVWFKYQCPILILYDVNVFLQDCTESLLSCYNGQKAVQYSINFVPREYSKFALVNFQKQVKPFGRYFENKYLYYPMHCTTL